MTETLVGFTKDQIVVITSKKKGEFLKPITSSKGSENSEGTPQAELKKSHFLRFLKKFQNFERFLRNYVSFENSFHMKIARASKNYIF